MKNGFYIAVFLSMICGGLVASAQVSKETQSTEATGNGELPTQTLKVEHHCAAGQIPGRIEYEFQEVFPFTVTSRRVNCISGRPGTYRTHFECDAKKGYQWIARLPDHPNEYFSLKPGEHLGRIVSNICTRNPKNVAESLQRSGCQDDYKKLKKECRRENLSGFECLSVHKEGLQEACGRYLSVFTTFTSNDLRGSFKAGESTSRVEGSSDHDQSTQEQSVQ